MVSRNVDVLGKLDWLTVLLFLARFWLRKMILSL